MRSIFFWLHLAAGCMGGAVILIMSVTGVLLTYERQILESGIPKVKPDAGIVPQQVEELLEGFRSRRGSLPAAVIKRAAVDAPVEFQMGREGSVYINPYTGQEVGNGASGARRFFRLMTDWHRWLGQEGEGRAMARSITGACNLAFLFLVASGIYLWMPRQWTWKHFRAISFFRGGLAGKARDFNWHNVFGIWMAVPLFFIVLSGVVMSYPWANDMLYKLTGSETPSPGGAPGTAVKKKGGTRGEKRKTGPPGFTAPPADLVLTNLNSVWAQVEESHSGWRSISLRLPGSRRAPWQFLVDKGNGARPDLRTTLTFDRETQQLSSRETFSDNNLGRRLRTWLRWIHTGEAGGLVGQTLAGLASFAGAMLVWTGIALALRRYAGWRKRGASGV